MTSALIQRLATATSEMSNPDAWEVINEAVRHAGYSARKSVPVVSEVWRARQEEIASRNRSNGAVR